MMEREIKFRGFDTANKIMYSADELGNDELQIHPNGKGFFNANPHVVGHSTFFDHIIPMQFTGLKEGGVNEGKELYFGDLMQAPSGNVFEIVWYEEEMRIALFNDGCYYGFNVPLYKLVGNIHENPELLTQLEKK